MNNSKMFNLKSQFGFEQSHYDFQILHLQKWPGLGEEQILNISVTTQQHRSTRVTLVIGSHAHHRRP